MTINGFPQLDAFRSGGCGCGGTPPKGTKKSGKSKKSNKSHKSNKSKKTKGGW